MKKLILILIALSVAVAALPVAAQLETNAPPETGTAPAENGGLPPGLTTPGGGGLPTGGNGLPPGAPEEAPPPAPGPNPGEPGRSGQDSSIQPTKPFAANQPALVSSFTPPESGTNGGELRLNFRNAPLEMVLNYLSDAAGFIIVLDTPVHGNVNVISDHPMSRDEAVDLLNEVLNQNGYAAIRDGRTLTILNKNDAKTRDIPVKVSNDPDSIPKNDEIVTQIIPIRFVDAGDLVKDLSSFVSPQATVVANDAGNSIVITDTQSNIRHVVEIIKAIDSSAEAETEIRVFRLKYASPTDVVNELSSVFPSSTSGSGSTPTLPFRFGGGFGGGFGRFFGGGGPGGAAGGTTGNSASDRIKKATQVNAVADARISAVIVTAPKDLIEEIAAMMKELDVPSERDQNVYVFHMDNADPQQAVQVLQNMFQSTSSSRGSGSSGASTTSALQQRQQTTAITTSSSSTTTGSSFTGNGGGGGGGGRPGGF